jgi:hypothetical protein
VRALILGVVWLGSGSCVEFGKSCTEIGCGDQARLTLRPKGGEWLPGAYEMSVTVDGVERRCAFSVPADLPEPRTGRSLCEPELPLYIQPETTCTEYRDGNSISQSCTPIPERYSASFTLDGTPPALAIVVERDGAVILEQTPALEYRSLRPNGPDCDPLCRQASAELEF